MDIQEKNNTSNKQKDHHPFENQIFDHFRKKQIKIKEAKQFLNENGFVVFEKTNYDKYTPKG
jgi:hypothetical protein